MSWDVKNCGTTEIPTHGNILNSLLCFILATVGYFHCPLGILVFSELRVRNICKTPLGHVKLTLTDGCSN
jgi:hypothetical protein